MVLIARRRKLRVALVHFLVRQEVDPEPAALVEASLAGDLEGGAAVPPVGAADEATEDLFN